METTAVLLTEPESLSLESLRLRTPEPDEAVIEIAYSGVSAGTERLFWSGKMPPFPGMGYPLVPGYESIGEVVEAGPQSGRRVGERVFVAGADCYEEARGLFGGTARRVVTKGARLRPVDAALGVEATLLALAATAYHVNSGSHTDLPELIIGHGVLGRLLARFAVAKGAPP
jgi:3-hydroxyethyl bacteriochlorophyllide a dehydrogenase